MTTRAIRVRRYDFAELAPPTRTPDGFLVAEGYITRSGVFTYRRADGSSVREYRPPDEVFRRESLDSFAAVPLTLEHPPRNLRPETVRYYQVGSVSKPERVGLLAKATVRVTDADAIAAVEGGLRELSCGYDCEIDDTPGMAHDSEGGLMSYDVVQRRITGNHVALTERGRAGSGVGLRLDSAADEGAAVNIGGSRADGGWTPTFVDDLPDEAFALVLPGGAKDASGKTIPRSLRLYPHHLPGVTDPADNKSVDVPMLREQIARLQYSGLDTETRIQAETHLRAHAAELLNTAEELARSDSTMAKVKIKINGVEYEVDQEIAAHIQRTDSELGQATAARTAQAAELEKMSGRLAVLESSEAKRTSADEQKKRADADAAELARRVGLLARLAGKSKKTSDELLRMDSEALMREIVAAERPEIRLDGRTPEFIMGVLESIPAPVNTADSLQRLVSGAGKVDAARQDSTDDDPIDVARRKDIEARRNAWRPAEAK